MKIEEVNNQNKKTLYEFSERLKEFNLKELDREWLIECFRLILENIIVYKKKIDIIYKYEWSLKKIDTKKLKTLK